MWTILLLALFLTFLALSFVPVDVSLEMERKRALSVKLGFRWLFVDLRRELTRTHPKARSERERPHRPRFPTLLRTFAEIRKVPGLWAAVRRLVVRLASSVRVLEVTGRMRLGTGDPADTGRLWALVGPLVLWCNHWSPFDVGVEPDFSDACLTGTLGGTVRLYPARLAYSVSSVMFSITTVRLVLAVVRSRPWKH